MPKGAKILSESKKQPNGSLPLLRVSFPVTIRVRRKNRALNVPTHIRQTHKYKEEFNSIWEKACFFILSPYFLEWERRRHFRVRHRTDRFKDQRTLHQNLLHLDELCLYGLRTFRASRRPQHAHITLITNEQKRGFQFSGIIIEIHVPKVNNNITFSSLKRTKSRWRKSR